jgi:hypothetical protein
MATGVVAGITIRENENSRVTQGQNASVAGYAIVRFAEAAKIENISALLAANGATIIDGPTTDGLYRVRIAALPKPDTVYRGIENIPSAEQQRDRAVANLRAATAIVQFATPQP